MSNRNRILKFCRERNLEVVSLEYVRNRGHAYGDSWDNSFWELVLRLNNEEHLYAPEDDTVEQAIQQMFANIEEDIKQ